eukprot:337190-Amphidinium_carterae.1
MPRQLPCTRKVEERDFGHFTRASLSCYFRTSELRMTPPQRTAHAVAYQHSALPAARLLLSAEAEAMPADRSKTFSHI